MKKKTLPLSAKLPLDENLKNIYIYFDWQNGDNKMFVIDAFFNLKFYNKLRLPNRQFFHIKSMTLKKKK